MRGRNRTHTRYRDVIGGDEEEEEDEARKLRATTF